MLNFLDSMYRVAKNKEVALWNDLCDGTLVVYEGYIYILIGSEKENELSKYLLQVAEEMQDFSVDEVDNLLDIKDYSKLRGRVTKRALGPEEEIETLPDNFKQYLPKLRNLIEGVTWK